MGIILSFPNINIILSALAVSGIVENPAHGKLPMPSPKLPVQLKQNYSNNTYSFYLTGMACRQKYAVPLCMLAPHGIQNHNNNAKSCDISDICFRSFGKWLHTFAECTVAWYSPQVSCGYV